MLLAMVAWLWWPSPAHAQSAGDGDGWSTTFVPASAASRVPGGVTELVVVAAGPASPERDAAAAMLATTLRSAGTMKLVLDGSTLGELGPIDDPAVLARCAALPVTHVAVVRLLEGAPPKVLVTLYAKAGGDVLAAFVATKGTALDPGATAPVQAGSPQAGDGVSEKAMKTVGAIQQQDSEDFSESTQRYEERFVGYDEVTQGQGLATIQTAHFWVGKYKQPVADAALYEAVNRPDLAARYTRRNQWRWGGMVGGAALATAGLVVMSTVMFSDPCELDFDDPDPNYDACVAAEEARFARRMTIGGILGGVGTIGLLAFFTVDPHPVSMSERRRLADEHNRALRRELRLPVTSARTTPPGSLVQLRFTPALTPHFQGVMLEGRF